jgi:hypothetical protein
MEFTSVQFVFPYLNVWKTFIAPVFSGDDSLPFSNQPWYESLTGRRNPKLSLAIVALITKRGPLLEQHYQILGSTSQLKPFR